MPRRVREQIDTADSQSPDTSHVGELFSAFLEAQLDAENKRRDQLISGAEKLVTASAAFVALLVAVAALALGDSFKISGDSHEAAVSRFFVISAIVAFVGSGAFAFAVQAVRPVKMPSRSALDEIVQLPVWAYSPPKARNLIALQTVTTVKSLRDANDKRVEWFKAAGVCQLVALICVAIAVLFAFALPSAPAEQPKPQVICLNGPCPSPQPGS